jgi:hypothetical protein
MVAPEAKRVWRFFFTQHRGENALSDLVGELRDQGFGCSAPEYDQECEASMYARCSVALGREELLELNASLRERANGLGLDYHGVIFDRPDAL